MLVSATADEMLENPHEIQEWKRNKWYKVMEMPPAYKQENLSQADYDHEAKKRHLKKLRLQKDTIFFVENVNDTYTEGMRQLHAASHVVVFNPKYPNANKQIDLAD